MRIISGKYKSRKIYSPRLSKTFRPSSDKTRETLFNIIMHRVEVQGTACVDLFSGTGAYGFEALSRGASSCDFVDISGSGLRLVERTASELGCTEKVNVIKSDAAEFLRSNESADYNIIFADPPYDYENYMELIRLVLKKNFKVFVLECSKQTLQALSAYSQQKKFKVIDKINGRTCLKIFISVNSC